MARARTPARDHPYERTQTPRRKPVPPEDLSYKTIMEMNNPLKLKTQKTRRKP